MVKTVKILGTEYKVHTGVSALKDPELSDRFGYCSFVNHKIVVVDLDTVEEWKDEQEEVKQIEMRATLRHEVIHAFLCESGLKGGTVGVASWALNEEMVDWLAWQLPKIIKVFQQLDCMEG